MTVKKRDAALRAAELLWAADRYRQYAELSTPLRERAKDLAGKLEGLAASTLCRGFQRPTMVHHEP